MSETRVVQLWVVKAMVFFSSLSQCLQRNMKLFRYLVFTYKKRMKTSLQERLLSLHIQR